MGLYLDPSLRHAISVSSVLNIEIEMVSHQFHVQHEEFFKTMCPISGTLPTISQWQSLSLFNQYRLHNVQPTEEVSGPDIVIRDQDQQKEKPVIQSDNNKYVQSSKV